MVRFEVPGEPRGKGRPRFTRWGNTYTDDKTRAYEDLIVACYKQAAGGFRFADSAFIELEVSAYYSIPKSATKAEKTAMQSGERLPSRKPDIDNVLKAVMDALNGVAYKDDSRVVKITARKTYGEPRLVIELKGG